VLLISALAAGCTVAPARREPKPKAHYDRHLVGASRPMTGDQIAEHNARLAERKEKG
jgi:hypothetical protein